MTNAEVAFAEENKALGSSYKMKQKMTTSLKKAQEGWNKIVDDLQEMRLENLALSKEYTKLVEDSFCCASIFLTLHCNRWTIFILHSIFHESKFLLIKKL